MRTLRHLLPFLLFLASGVACAQNNVAISTQKKNLSYAPGGLSADSFFRLPARDLSPWLEANQFGSLFINKNDSFLYYFNGLTYIPLNGSSGSVVLSNGTISKLQLDFYVYDSSVVALELQGVIYDSVPSFIQTYTLQYRLASMPDVPGNYNTVSSSNLVYLNGKFQLTPKIISLANNTAYLVRLVNEANSTVFDTLITTPIQFSAIATTGGNDTLIMQGMHYEKSYELGVRDSYLPSVSGGGLHSFAGGSLTDLLGNYPNATWLNHDSSTATGINYIFRHNEAGILLDTSLLYFKTGKNADGGSDALTLLNTGAQPYTIGIWVNPTKSELDNIVSNAQKDWLWYIRSNSGYTGAYIGNDRKAHWIRTYNGNTEEIVTSATVDSNTWNRFLFRHDASNSDNSILLTKGNVNDYGFDSLMSAPVFTSSGSVTGSFSSATNFAGDNAEPILIGCGRETYNSAVKPIVAGLKQFFFAPSYLDGNSAGYQQSTKILQPEYPFAQFADRDSIHHLFSVPFHHFPLVSNSQQVFYVPMSAPVGDKLLRIVTPTGPRAWKGVHVEAPPAETGYNIDFTQPGAVDSFLIHFNMLHSQWGGDANGGVSSQNIFLHNGNLVLEAHGDAYDGNVIGVNKDHSKKYHTITNDPLWGSDPKLGQPWVTRVGSVTVAKNYSGYGHYEVRCKFINELGSAPAFWTFHYLEEYPTCPQYYDWQSKGLYREGSLNDGYYIVANNEIDIENPSHLPMYIFDTWDEEATAYYWGLNSKYIIAVENDPVPSRNGTFQVIDTTGTRTYAANQASLGSNAVQHYANWAKISDSISRSYNPALNNIKCNTWTGETGSGSGVTLGSNTIDKSENYVAYLTRSGVNLADGNYHTVGFTWIKDKVIFYVDSVQVNLSKYFIPYIWGKFTIGPWFPSGTDTYNATTAPWLPKPTKEWAGVPAQPWKYKHLSIQRITFTPYDSTAAGGVTLKLGETYPYGGDCVLIKKP